MTKSQTMNVLANPVLHALTDCQAQFAETRGRVARFDPDIAPFNAVPDEPTDDDWDALRELVGPDGVAFLLREPVAIPDGWETEFEIPAVQMIADETVAAGDDLEVLPLTKADVPEMLALVEKTKPGPFRPRTIELGNYIGVRVDGELIAMAGERIRIPGRTEVSAVCTDERFRGRGLAAALVRTVNAGILERGDLPMLHAAANNEGALRIYEQLGFRRTNPFTGIALRPPT